MIAAILRAQFLSMRWGRATQSRGRGSVLRFVPLSIWYLFWLGIAACAFFLASLGDLAQLRRYLPLGFLGVTAYWQLMPLLSASMGMGLDLRKLRIYPARHLDLFAVEVLLCFTTAVEMLLVIAGGAAGLLTNEKAGGFLAGPRIAGAAALLVLFNALLASGTRSLLGRLLAKRKIREVVILATTCLWMAPRLLMQLHIHPKWLGPVEQALRGPKFPWSAAAAAALGDVTPFLTLGLWLVAALWFGRSQFERSLSYDVTAAQAMVVVKDASRRRPLFDAFFAFPRLLWRDPLAAIVEKELRSLVRTPRFRMVFVMGFTFGILVWLPMVIGGNGIRQGSRSSYFLVFVCIYALTMLGQVTYWNCFGFDRSAALFYFAAPQPISQVLIGKNIAAMVFVYLDVTILSAVVGTFHLASGWGQVGETMLVVGVCAVYLLGLGNMASVNYARPLNAENVSRGGGSGRSQGLLLVFYPLALLPVFLAYLARWALNSELAFAAVLAIAAAIGGAVYWIGLDSAVTAARVKREQLMMALTQGEGPVASE
jgi:ABC-2 type transport system permease protein